MNTKLHIIGFSIIFATTLMFSKHNMHSFYENMSYLLHFQTIYLRNWEESVYTKLITAYKYHEHKTIWYVCLTILDRTYLSLGGYPLPHFWEHPLECQLKILEFVANQSSAANLKITITNTNLNKRNGRSTEMN